MSKNRLFVISESLSNKIELSLIRRGHLDFSVVRCTDLEEVNLEAERTVVVCKNALIEQLLEKLQADGDELGLIFEQAVTLKREGKDAIFIPIELDVEKFLDEFLEKGDVAVVSVFGKSLSAVQSDFDKLGVDYKIITKSQFLHTVYYAGVLELEVLQGLGDCVFSTEDESLESACEKLISEKELSLAVTTQKVWLGLSKVLKVCKILDENAELEGEDFKQKTYNVAKNLLREADLVACVLQDESRGYVAVGNKTEIHVFSTIHVDDILSAFATFRLFRFVKEKYQ